MRITQGTFSYLPDLTDEQIEAQLRFALRNGWAIMVEHTDDPHPRNALWEMWDAPQFDLIEDDVEGARALGMRAYLVDRDGRAEVEDALPTLLALPALIGVKADA